MSKQYRMIVALVVIGVLSLACGLGQVASPTQAPVAVGGGQQLEQWASGASASSQYGDPAWAAIQATGAPDTDECGDYDTAWASLEADSPYEWLELTYRTAVIPQEIKIYETYNPGSIISVAVGTANFEHTIIWEADPRPNTACPYVLTIPVDGFEQAVNSVRIEFDQSIIGSWNEIDAVQLIGSRP